jgi:glutathione S-transferase kappa 1
MHYRLLTATALDAPEHLTPVTRELWTRIWSKDQDITQTESLAEACAAAGLTDALTQSLLERMQHPEVKAELKAVTDAAVSRGAYGAPWFSVGDAAEDGSVAKWHPFFGSDRFEQIAALIGQPWLGPDPTKQQQQDVTSKL